MTSSGRTRPRTARLGQVTSPATVVIGDRDYPIVIGCGDAIAARIPRLWPDHHPGPRITCPLPAPAQLAELIDRLNGDGARAGTS